MAWAPLYATSAELKAYTRIPSADTVDDAQVALALEAASRAVDHFCGRQFGLVAAAEARFYNVKTHADGRQSIYTDDFMTTTGLVIALDTNRDLTYATTVVNAECILSPFNAAPKSRPWGSIVLPRTISYPSWPEYYYPYMNTDTAAAKVTAKYGWTTVPDTIKQATLIQASRFLKRRESPWGVAGSPDLGNELRLLRQVDVDVQVALEPYRRWDSWGG